MIAVAKQNPYLRPYYIIAFLTELYFIIPIWLFFYLRILNYQQVSFLIAYQAIITVILEVPTGAFADLVGKKITLVIAFLVWSVANMIFPLAQTFIVFVVLETLKGFAKSMYSGSFEAMTYDTLKERNQESLYDKVIADFTSLSWIALFISAFTGGFLYYLNYGLPYYLTGIIYFFIAIIFIFYTTEPKIDTEKYELNLKNYLTQLIKGTHEIFINPKTSITSIFLIVITFGYFMASEFMGISQAQNYGMGGIAVGFLFGTGYLISAAFSQLFPKMREKFGEKSLMVGVVVVLISSFIFAKFVGVIVGSVLIISRISSSTTFINLKSIMVNRYISSKNRATALSAMNLFVTLPYAAVQIIAGGYIEKTSPNQFAFVLGIFLSGLLLIVLLVNTLTKTETPKV